MQSELQLEHGYWGARLRSGEGIPDKTIARAQEYHGSDQVSISCTQLRDVSASEQKRVVSDWCKALPNLSIKTLWFHSRVPQALFDAAAQIAGLEALYVKWGGLKSISALADAKTLRALHIGSNPSISSVSCLSKLTTLEALSLENIPAASDLCFAKPLSNLWSFELHGSMWTTQKIKSVEPLGALPLKLFGATNAKVLEGGLVPLLKIKTLVNVRVAFFYPEEEFVALRKQLPALRFGSAFDEESIKEFCRTSGRGHR